MTVGFEVGYDQLNLPNSQQTNIVCDNANNHVTIAWTAGERSDTVYDDQIEVRNNGEFVGNIPLWPWGKPAGAQYFVDNNIDFYGGAGNDSFEVLTSLKVAPAGETNKIVLDIYGGQGNDTLKGSDLVDYIWGGTPGSYDSW